MAGAFVCASLGIVPTVRHADYIGSWLEVLREDNRAVVRAASAASKAADFLHAFLPPAINSVVEGNEEARDSSVRRVSVSPQLVLRIRE
jgi:antirestriction protein ArdC